MVDLNKDEWAPPPLPLTPELIQRGQSPVFHVMHEHATDPFGAELEHWSALPALSYFALNAVAMRESSRRIKPPTRFRPPPRVTLSEGRCQYWLADLGNATVPLRKLSRTIPHGYSGLRLLEVMLDRRVPIGRAVWFIKCIGANEVRVLKRKAGLGDNGAERNESIERAWLKSWTEAVQLLVSNVIDSYDAVSDPPNDDNNTDAPTNVTSSDAGDDRAASRFAGRSDGSGVDLAPDGPPLDGPARPDRTRDRSPQDVPSNDALSNGINPTNDHSPGRPATDSPEELDDDVDDLFADETEIQARTASKRDRRNGERARRWQQKMEYTTHLLMGLYNESLLDRQALLDWLLAELRSTPVIRLPCFVHFVQLLWAPLTNNFMAPQLLRTVALRLGQAAASPVTHTVVTNILEPIVFKLVSTNDNAFVTPRTWPLIEPYVRGHPAYARLMERNQAFMTKDSHDPSDWSHLLAVGALMSSFARPYRFAELVNNLRDLDISGALLIKTILSRTIRTGTTASNLLCLNLLKRLRVMLPHIDIADLSVDFLLDTHPGHSSSFLNALISDLISSKLFHLSKYLNRIISRDVLFVGDPCRQMHLDVLCSLPTELLTPSMRTQVTMMLRKSGLPEVTPDLDAIVANALGLMLKKRGQGLALIDVSHLRLNSRRQLAEKLVTAFTALTNPALTPSSSASPPSFSPPASSFSTASLASSENGAPVVDSSGLPDPAAFAEFCRLVDRASVGTVRPMARLLSVAVSCHEGGPSFLSGVIRQVHIRLMALMCAGFIDTFIRHFTTRLEHISHEYADFVNEMATWVSWDDINALRSVIQDPAVMLDFHRLVPMRSPAGHTSIQVPAAGNTPMERDTVRSLLHRPAPDIAQLLSMRGDDSLANEIAEYSHLPGADLPALLQLVAYSAVKIHDIVEYRNILSGSPNATESPIDERLLHALFIAPANELGFSYEEVEALRYHRHQYLDSLEPNDFLRLCVLLNPYRFASRVAHHYPDVFEAKLVKPAIDSPEHLDAIIKSLGEVPDFNSLLTTCTPFNLRFRQSMISLKYRKSDAEVVAQEILDAAYANPSNSSALQGLLHTVSDEVKNKIFSKTVELFLNEGLTPGFLAIIDVPFNLVGALAAAVHPPLQWDLGKIPEFLGKLVELAQQCVYSQRSVLRKALILVLRISVVGRLNNLEMSASAVSYLDKLLHVELFADNHRMRTIIEDALRLLLRISQPQGSRLYTGSDQQLTAGGGVTDGLQLYSKSSDQYGPLPVWSFDLIEETSACAGNDGPVDLSLFEAYQD